MSVAIAAIVAFSGIELRLNQIAVGFVLFLLARSLALFLGDSYVGRAGPKVPAQDVPLLSDIPFFGTVLFSHNLSVYGAYVAVLVVYVFIYRTRPGLELRGIGERPAAAFARGVPVNRLRYVYTLVGRGARRNRRGGRQPRPDRRVAGEPDDQPRVDRPRVRHLRRLAPGARRHRLRRSTAPCCTWPASCRAPSPSSSRCSRNCRSC